MWTAPKDKTPPSPDQFEQHWLDYQGRDDVTLKEILELTGPLDGLRVLDIGGGPLMARAGHTEKCDRYTLVDFSPTACRLAEEADDSVCAICMDVFGYLQVTTRFDLTLCFGLVEYLSPGDLRRVFELTPSPVLCLGTATAESYLQYPGRLVAYEPRDIERYALETGWTETKRLPRPSHVLARYERRER